MMAWKEYGFENREIRLVFLFCFILFFTTLYCCCRPWANFPFSLLIYKRDIIPILNYLWNWKSVENVNISVFMAKNL